MAKTSQRQVVAEIRPVSSNGRQGPRFNGKWAQVTGGEITAAVEKVYDGGARFPDTLCAPPEVGDITVTRHFDPDRDGAPLKRLRQEVGSSHYDVYVYTLNCDLKEAGTERVYANALIVGLTEPEGDSSSGSPSTYALTFSIGAVSAAR
jgi:hypothetical protein